ncbi:FAD-dependent oxidoreductase [bacterium]|nr:FAD-dependent oxidoreductase [bacterium]
MPRVTIDGREVEVGQGATLLDAARSLGIDIPTLCFREDCRSATSCMICLVKVKGRNALVPSCATQAVDGMDIESETEEVRDARRAGLELLLSDHVGDCVGPCHNLCPANMDIPRMIRQIAGGELHAAVETVKARIALPATLGRICPGPCEKGCRRADADAAVSICLLKRHVADVDLASGEPFLPACAEPTGRMVAVIGAGPTGLSAAYYLLQRGHAVTVYDENEQAGGMLVRGVPEEALPRDVVAAEADVVKRLGAEFRLGTHVASLDEIEADAVMIATGTVGEGEAFGLATTKTGIEADKASLATSRAGAFVGGGAIRPQRMAVRSCADGWRAAESVHQFLSGADVTGPAKLFTTRVGKVSEEELAVFLADASGEGRHETSDGLSDEGARAEAARCLHCDCRKPVACRLRKYSDAYGASASRYKVERRAFEQDSRHPTVIYEVGKCISCGLCVQIAEAAGEELGLAFVGRGFAVRVSVPFSETLEAGLKKAAAACAEACPTGALAMR